MIGDPKTGEMAELALRAVRNGYPVIPVRARSKSAALMGWRSVAWEVPALCDVERYFREHPDHSIGIACGFRTVAIDIDLDHPDEVERAVALVESRLGVTPLKRIGKAPHLVLLYRTEMPIPSIRMPSMETIGLGAQVLAYGIHPQCQQPYRWLSGGSPADVPLSALPSVTFADVYAVMQDLPRATDLPFSDFQFDLDLQPVLRLMSSRSTLLKLWLLSLVFGRERAHRLAYTMVQMSGPGAGGPKYGLIFSPKTTSAFSEEADAERLAGLRHGFDPAITKQKA